MFQRVMVGVDGRPSGRDAIALARLLVAPNGRLTLTHVDARDAAAAQRLLERERDASDVDADLAPVLAGSVGRGLHDGAEAMHADLLVVGSCSRGFVGRVLVGNDTRASLNGAPCAVAVASLRYASDMRALATIGVGYDGSPESQAALALARALAARHGAALRALDVVPLPGTPWAGFAGVALGAALDDLVAGAREQLEALEGVDGETLLGIAGEELAAFGERVDLLIVGSRGYGPVRRLMFGSTSEYLAGHARCPLIVLPRRPGPPAGTGRRPGANRPSERGRPAVRWKITPPTPTIRGCQSAGWGRSAELWRRPR